MNGQQLHDILTSVPHVKAKFYGIFGQMHLPQYKLSEETVIIVNTRVHWCVIYLPRDGNIEYFDPLGRPPTQQVKDFIRLQQRPYEFNHTRVLLYFLRYTKTLWNKDEDNHPHIFTILQDERSYCQTLCGLYTLLTVYKYFVIVNTCKKNKCNLM